MLFVFVFLFGGEYSKINLFIYLYLKICRDVPLIKCKPKQKTQLMRTIIDGKDK